MRMSPVCADCRRPICESTTGVKTRGTDSVCDACFYTELGDHLPADMPGGNNDEVSTQVS